MNEPDQQKFFSTVKTIFQKKSRNTREKQLLRQFFKTCKSSKFWMKITKNNDKLLDLLAEKFLLIEYAQDTALQLKGIGQEKNVILILEGQVEVKYEVNNPFYDQFENNYLFDSRCTDNENSPTESAISIDRSPFKRPMQKKMNRDTPKRSVKQERDETMKQMQEFLQDKGQYFYNYSVSDLDYVEVNMLFSNKRRVNEKTFMQNIKTKKQIITNEDDEFYFDLPKFSESFHVVPKDKKEQPVISLFTEFEPGDVMNKYLFNDKEMDYDDLIYVAISGITTLTLDRKIIDEFLQEKHQYLYKYDSFLDELFCSDPSLQNLTEDEIDLIKDTYCIEENTKQGDQVVIVNQQEPSFSFYLIKEGFFDLQIQSKKNKLVSIQNQYNFKGNEVNQKQIITVQNKKDHNVSYNTIAMLQKGQIFGEEVIFNYPKKYQFTVTKKTPYSEILQFKFMKIEQIPEPLLQFIARQYESKQQIEIESDGEEENEIQDQISAKYSNFFGNSSSKRIGKQNYLDSNLNFFQIDVSKQNLQQPQILTTLAMQKQNKQQLKKIMLNELVQSSLDQCKHNNNSISEYTSQQILDQQFLQYESTVLRNNRCQSGGETHKDNQPSFIEQKDFDAYSPKPIITQNCRKNQFVKKAIKVNGIFQSRPSSADNHNNNHNQNYHLKQDLHQFPPIHAQYQHFIPDFDQQTQRIQERPINDNQSSVIDSQQSKKIIFSKENLVKTIKIQFERKDEEIRPTGGDDTPSLIFYDQNHILQPTSTRKIQSSNSPRRNKGELMQGRSLCKFNERISATLNNIQHERVDPPSDNNQQHNFKYNEEDNSSMDDQRFLRQTINDQYSPIISPQKAERVITDGLKASKIRKTSPEIKKKREEDSQKSALIKLLYNIEHEKWVVQQQTRNQVLNQIQNYSSSNSLNRQNLINKPKREELDSQKSFNSIIKMQRDNFLRNSPLLSNKKTPYNSNNSLINIQAKVKPDTIKQINNKSDITLRQNKILDKKAFTSNGFFKKNDSNIKNIISTKALNNQPIDKSVDKTRHPSVKKVEDKQVNFNKVKIQKKASSSDGRPSQNQKQTDKHPNEEKINIKKNLTQQNENNQKRTKSNQNIHASNGSNSSSNLKKPHKRDDNSQDNIQKVPQVSKQPPNHQNKASLKNKLQNKSSISQEDQQISKTKLKSNNSLSQEKHFKKETKGEQQAEVRKVRKEKIESKNELSHDSSRKSQDQGKKQLKQSHQNEDSEINARKSQHHQTMKINHNIEDQKESEEQEFQQKQKKLIKNIGGKEELEPSLLDIKGKAKDNQKDRGTSENNPQSEEKMEKKMKKRKIQQSQSESDDDNNGSKQNHLQPKASIQQKSHKQQDEEQIHNKIFQIKQHLKRSSSKDNRSDQKVKNKVDHSDKSLQRKNETREVTKISEHLTPKTKNVEKQPSLKVLNKHDKSPGKQSKIQHLKQIYSNQQNGDEKSIITGDKQKKLELSDSGIKKHKKETDQHRELKYGEDEKQKQQNKIEKKKHEQNEKKYEQQSELKVIREEQSNQTIQSSPQIKKKDKMIDHSQKRLNKHGQNADNDDEEQQQQNSDENSFEKHNSKALKNIITRLDNQNNEDSSTETKLLPQKFNLNQLKSLVNENTSQKKQNTNGNSKSLNKTRPYSPQQRQQKINDLNKQIQNNQQTSISENGKIINQLKKMVSEQKQTQDLKSSKVQLTSINLNEQAQTSSKEMQ